MNLRRTLMKISLLAAIGIGTVSCSKDENVMAGMEPDLSNAPHTHALTGRTAAEWKEMSGTVFTTSIPADWRHVALPSIDTYNGILTNGRDSINYEYGIQPDTFRIDRERFTVRYEIVDGRQAKMLSGERMGMVIDRVHNAGAVPRSFIMMQSSDTPLDPEVALRMMRSVVFRK